VKRDVIWSLLCSCVLSTMALSQASGPRELTTAEAAEFERVIGTVKSLPAHKLDRMLPVMAFADWLHAEVGSQTRITWAFSGDFDAPGPRDHVEVGIHAQDGRNLFVNVTVGTAVHRPHVLAVWLITPDLQSTDVHMRDVPSMLRDIRGELENEGSTVE
jgi:hypothetical protein